MSVVDIDISGTSAGIIPNPSKLVPNYALLCHWQNTGQQTPTTGSTDDTSAIADARHQEVLPSANSISKYRVTR